MTEIVKKSATIILAEINKSKNILLHCHPSPDPDSVGSSLAMKFALEGMGKKVTLIQGDNVIPKAFDFPGVQTITQKSYGDINANDFDLFIVLDSASKGMISFKTDVIFPENMRVVVIDHHISNIGYGHVNCIDSTYPATAQIVFDLLKEMNVKLTHDIALSLFMGIYADTGAFQFGVINSNTFNIISELVGLAPEFQKTVFTMNNSNSKGRLIFEGLALTSVQTFYDGLLAISVVSDQQIKDKNINKDDVLGSNVSNKLMSVVGTHIGVCIIESEPNMIKISFRSRDADKYDVSKLATMLGGGGHRAAAGARLNMTTTEALNKVVETVKILYNL